MTAATMILGESCSGTVKSVGSAYATRALDIGGIYAEITVRIEGGRWGGRLGNRLIIHPRPSIPITVQVFTEDWKTLEEIGLASALDYALEKVTEQAVDWVSRFVLSIPAEAR